MCDKMVTTGYAYTETCRSFSVSIKDLAMHFTQGEVVAVSWEWCVFVCYCILKLLCICVCVYVCVCVCVCV